MYANMLFVDRVVHGEHSDLQAPAWGKKAMSKGKSGTQIVDDGSPMLLSNMFVHAVLS